MYVCMPAACSLHLKGQQAPSLTFYAYESPSADLDGMVHVTSSLNFAIFAISVPDLQFLLEGWFAGRASRETSLKSQGRLTRAVSDVSFQLCIAYYSLPRLLCALLSLKMSSPRGQKLVCQHTYSISLQHATLQCPARALKMRVDACFCAKAVGPLLRSRCLVVFEIFQKILLFLLHLARNVSR